MTVEATFNLRHMPFERDIPTNSLYLSRSTMELLSRLEFAARKRKFVAVTGDVGVGNYDSLHQMESPDPPMQKN